MALGRQTEMAHQYTSEELKNHELYQERDYAVDNLAKSSLYLASVCAQFNEAQQDGNIPAELWKANTDAQVDNVRAMEWLIKANTAIHEAGI